MFDPSPSRIVPARSLVASLVLALAIAPPVAAQDWAQERQSLGADSLFGPGIVDLAGNGRAVKVRLTRPAYVVAFALAPPAVVQLVLPRRQETRLTRAGDLWVDLPRPAAGAEAVPFSVQRVEVSTVRVAPVGAPAPALPPPSVFPRGAPPAGVGALSSDTSSTGTVTLVIVADSAWSREVIVPLLPPQLEGSLMEMARTIVVALTGGRGDAWAAYLVRW